MTSVATRSGDAVASEGHAREEINHACHCLVGGATTRSDADWMRDAEDSDAAPTTSHQLCSTSGFGGSL